MTFRIAGAKSASASPNFCPRKFQQPVAADVRRRIQAAVDTVRLSMYRSEDEDDNEDGAAAGLRHSRGPRNGRSIGIMLLRSGVWILLTSAATSGMKHLG